MPQSTLRVDLLGTSFTLTVDGDPAYLQAIYERYRTHLENTRKTTGMEDPLKLSILTGILLGEEVEKLRARSRSEEAAFEAMQTDQLLLDLINKTAVIEKTIPQNSRSQPETQGAEGIVG